MWCFSVIVKLLIKKTRKQEFVFCSATINGSHVTMLLLKNKQVTVRAGFSSSIHSCIVGVLPSDFVYVAERISKWAFAKAVNFKASWAEPWQTLLQGMVALLRILIAGNRQHFKLESLIAEQNLNYWNLTHHFHGLLHLWTRFSEPQ